MAQSLIPFPSSERPGAGLCSGSFTIPVSRRGQLWTPSPTSCIPKPAHTCTGGSAVDCLTGRVETLGMTKELEARALMTVIDRLTERFPNEQRSVIENIVAEEHELLDDGPIRDYVPVLVERAAKLRLAHR